MRRIPSVHAYSSITSQPNRIKPNTNHDLYPIVELRKEGTKTKEVMDRLQNHKTFNTYSSVWQLSKDLGHVAAYWGEGPVA